MTGDGMGAVGSVVRFARPDGFGLQKGVNITIKENPAFGIILFK